jgi:hypothetical protein
VLKGNRLSFLDLRDEDVYVRGPDRLPEQVSLAFDLHFAFEANLASDI